MLKIERNLISHNYSWIFTSHDLQFCGVGDKKSKSTQTIFESLCEPSCIYRKQMAKNQEDDRDL